MVSERESWNLKLRFLRKEESKNSNHTTPLQLSKRPGRTVTSPLETTNYEKISGNKTQLLASSALAPRKPKNQLQSPVKGGGERPDGGNLH